MRASFRAVYQRSSQRRRPIASISLFQSRATPTACEGKGVRAAGVFPWHCTCRLISVQDIREAALAAVIQKAGEMSK